MSACFSATAVIGGMSRERRHLFALPPFVGGHRKTLAPRVRATAYRKSLLTLSTPICLMMFARAMAAL